MNCILSVSVSLQLKAESNECEMAIRPRAFKVQSFFNPAFAYESYTVFSAILDLEILEIRIKLFSFMYDSWFL